MNSCIAENVDDHVSIWEKFTDAIFGRPKFDEMTQKALEKQEQERLSRLNRSARKQRKALDAARAALLGTPRSLSLEEVWLEEEAQLQSDQLARLKARYEGVLTLL